MKKSERERRPARAGAGWLNKSKVPVKRRAESSLRAMRVIKVVVGRAREGDKGRDKRRRGLV